LWFLLAATSQSSYITKPCRLILLVISDSKTGKRYEATVLGYWTTRNIIPKGRENLFQGSCNSQPNFLTVVQEAGVHTKHGGSAKLKRKNKSPGLLQ
jgi:hypothetical protein